MPGSRQTVRHIMNQYKSMFEPPLGDKGVNQTLSFRGMILNCNPRKTLEYNLDTIF